MRVEIIPRRYFNELVECGDTVPRHPKTGDVLPFRVGSSYKIKCDETGRVAIARCTQNMPYNLRLVEIQTKELQTA